MTTTASNHSVADTTELAVFFRKLAKLNEADKADVMELISLLVKSESESEQSEIGATISEIVSQKPAKVQKLDLADAQSVNVNLKKYAEWVGEKIRSYRENAKITQLKLSELTGLPQSHVSRLENGKHCPSYSTLEKIAKALNKPVSSFDFN